MIARKQARFEKDQQYQSGLVFANLGSQYDVSTNASTVGGASGTRRPSTHFSALPSNQDMMAFDRTEKAIRKAPYDTYWTVNMSE